MVHDNHVSLLEFTGKMLGKAVYEVKKYFIINCLNGNSLNHCIELSLVDPEEERSGCT